MKRILLLCAVAGLSVSVYLLAESSHKAKKRSVTFINEDEKSSVTLTIYHNDTGKIKTKRLSAHGALWAGIPWIGRSYTFHIKKSHSYDVKARENGANGLETSRHHIDADAKTVYVRRERPLVVGGERLVLKGLAD